MQTIQNLAIEYDKTYKINKAKKFLKNFKKVVDKSVVL